MLKPEPNKSVAFNDVFQQNPNTRLAALDATQMQPVDLTQAAENSVHAVVHIKSTQESKTQTVTVRDPFYDFFGDIFGNGRGGGLPPNGIVGVIGPNGAGKTTLFRLIMGLETVDKGTFEVGETVKLAYVDQQHKDIDPAKSVYQVISGGNELIRLGNRDINARAYLSRFNFSGADQEKLCGMLSGGERNRLHLAMALKEEGNVLLLDEPTNDIDVNTLRALEEGLDDFAGCAVVISHDRWFLDRICTHILAFEGNSEVFFFEGSYSEYEENKMKRLSSDLRLRLS